MTVKDETNREKVLGKVRKLVAKANSTTFEAERITFLAAADALMEKFAIEEWQLHQDDETSKRVERRDMDISWWWEMDDLHFEARSNIAYLWSSCVKHCRCYSTYSVWDSNMKTSAVYGTPSDLDYLDILFTDLFIQMSTKLKPRFDENITLGENMQIAKEAGLSWEQIAHWIGQPELIKEVWRYDRNSGMEILKTEVSGKLVTAYKKHLKDTGQAGKRITVHPDTWAINFMTGFVVTIQQRLKDMRGDRESTNTGSMELVLRDIRDEAREAMFEDFPHLRPHPAGCDCVECKKKRKPVKASVSRGRKLDWNAYSHGSEEGAAARIRSNDPGVGRTQELEG